MKSLPAKFRIRAPWVAVPLVAWFARPTPLLLGIGAAIAVLGLLVRGWAAGTLHKNTQLTTTGPYAFTRNPLYLGSFLMGLGIGVATGRLWLFAGFIVFFAWLYRGTIRREAEYLEGVYGDEFRSYAAGVPAFWPRLTPHRRQGEDSAAFSLDRYLQHREWEAALGVAAGLGFLAAKLVWTT
jgi:protein-S-isoprenylcysteine O-methyltransferase Ste14